MRALAENLISYVERHFYSSLARVPNGPVRPILVGPPDAALREMFSLLTANGQSEWQVQVNGARHDVVVLLVDGNTPPAGNALSGGCHWDYAVTIRNSRPLVLILAAPASWDLRPESLVNTTETLGTLGTMVRAGEDAIQKHLEGSVAAHLSIGERDAKELIRLVRREASNLEPGLRDGMPWDAINNLLAASVTGSPRDVACRAIGLPVIGSSTKTFGDAYEALRSLASFVGSEGLRDAVDQLKQTNSAQASGIGPSLDSLQLHLSTRAYSPTAFETAPSYYYRVTDPIPPWYDSLTTTALEEALTELNQTQPQDRLVLTCTNGLPGVNPIARGPFVVLSTPELAASSKSGIAPGTARFSRKVDRSPESVLAPLSTDPLCCTDAAPPAHRKPIKYKVDAPTFKAGTVDVLVLETFACGGVVVARDAERNALPVYSARPKTWNQELVLPRGGSTELAVLHGTSAVQVSLGLDGESPSVLPTVAGSHSVAFTVDVEDNDVFSVSVLGTAGTIIGTWTLQIAVRDIEDVSDSRLEALIWEHRTKRKSVPHAPDTILHRLELGSYLPSPDSWRPVIACWTCPVSSRLSIDWQSDRFLGEIQPQIDPRPQMQPPAVLLAAREEVRALFLPEQRCLSEIDLANPVFAEPVERYLSRYTEWMKQDPQAACWQDVIAIHAAEWNQQAGADVATEEPVVIILSPLHPFRLAWHVVAQKQLVDALSKPCPAAGLLSPSQCPDAGSLFLWDGHAAKPRAFYSLPCEHPHWSVLLNTTFLDKKGPRSNVMQRLAELGLLVQAITGGFTSQQTQDSLHEVNRLLPARATLRVGVVGDAESSSECGEGVFQWSEKQHSHENVAAMGCLQVEIFDTRGAPDPTPEQLADLSDATAEKVRWFKLRPDAPMPWLDLTIIDQLGVRSPEAASGTTRSAVSSACLFRVRVREDFQNARAILESRVASTRLAGNELSVLLARSVQAYEETCSQDADSTHFRFTPNQDAVGSRLRHAIFLSVTSSQVDPACIVRGTVGQGGYLWDYELPGVLGGGESSLGYYLVAKPTAAMCKAVEKAAELVSTPPPNIPGLLEEVSRHGIPILKRLASGGSQSRGELGLLLATRLLQDAFRASAPAPRLPVWTQSCIHLVLPVDPYEDLFDRLRKALLPPTVTAQRPDLVVVAIHLRDSTRPVAIKLTPVEVKYRAMGMAASDMRDALAQAANLGRLLNAVWIHTPATDLWKTCGNALLAQFLDFGFRIYAANWLHGHQPAEWAESHQRVMQDILEGTAEITIATAGRLIVFDGSPTTRVADLDGDNRQDTIVVSQDDARALLAGTGSISTAGDSSVTQMDFSFPGCGNSVTPAVSPAPAAAPHLPSTLSPEATLRPTDPPTVTVALVAPATAEPSVASVSPPAPAVQASASRIPPEIRAQVRSAFEGFIGNENSVTRLSNDLLRALIEQPPHLAKNYLFTGLPSTGKTELARRVSQALRLPFVKLDGRGVSSRDKLFELVNGELGTHSLVACQVGQQVGLPVMEYPPLIIFIDEVHLVPRGIQEALLTMLEAADRTVVLLDHVARVQRATFLFATTRVSDVDAAFASRCDEIQLREYTEEEVARILRWKVPHDEWHDPVYLSVAKLGRCVPRIAIQLAEALETAELVSETEKPLEAHLDDVRHAREIDDNGLTRMDFEYLSILERSNGPVGEQNILNLMRTVDKDRILNEVEPFLVRLSFIKHGPRGRELTGEGRDYLLAHRLAGQKDT
jgi:Holliday junction resolvasome RuvABC ATP-dependent DNA helicase subunit